MKKLLLLFTVLFCFVLGNAQELYEVTSKKSLNVRNSASYNSTVIGSIESGRKVNVYETIGEWSKIEYKDQFAYVNNKYLQKYHFEEEETSFVGQLNLDNVKWLAFVILGLSITLAVFRKALRKSEVLNKVPYTWNLIILTLTCIIEIIYVMIMGDASIWYCIPDNVGWIGAIIGFITLGWVAYNQLMCFMDALIEIRYYAGNFDVRVGLYSWPIAIIAALISSLFGWEDGYIWIFSALGICQLIQFGLIIAGVLPKRGFLHSLLVIAIYLIGSIATLLIVIQFIALLIMVIIIGFFIMAFLSGAGSRSSSSSSSSEQRGHLVPRGGVPISGTFQNDDTFYGDGGFTYKRECGDYWRKL